MSEAKAWLLSLDKTKEIAIGYHHIIEYVDIANCSLISVPLSFGYASSLMIREGEILPIIDLAKYFNPKLKDEDVTGVILVNYQEAPEQPLKQGGIIIRNFPKEILVTTEMGCLLPEKELDWHAMADACLEYNDKPVPVLKVEKIFDASLKPLFYERLKKLRKKAGSKNETKSSKAI